MINCSKYLLAPLVLKIHNMDVGIEFVLSFVIGKDRFHYDTCEEFLNGASYHFKQVLKDDMVPDLLILPPGSDLHDHPLVADGSIFLQVSI